MLVTMVTISGLYSHTQKSSKLHLCAGCDKKETGCMTVTAVDTLEIHQVSNGVHGVSKLGQMVQYRRDFYRC